MFCHFCHLNDKSEEFARCFKISIWLSEFQYIKEKKWGSSRRSGQSSSLPHLSLLYLSGAHHSRVCETRISNKQLFRERLSEKVHATILKGIVSIVVVLSSLFFKEIAKMAREAMDLCLRLLQVSNKSKFDSYVVRNSVFRSYPILPFFRQPFSK